MLVKALKSFAGKISMGAGELREIKDEFILNDLLGAGYIEEAKIQNAEIVEKPVEQPKASPKKRVEKKNKK